MKMARVIGGKTWRIGKILCVGRNYQDHIRELGNTPPEFPVIFMKPASCVIGDGEKIIIPACSRDCHHEVELAVLIGRKGKDIPVDRALKHVAGYGVAIDVTLRDLQANLKSKGLPWERAKAFDTACPLSHFVDASMVPDPQNLQLRLSVNGELRQNGNTSMMIYDVATLIHLMSGCFTLEPGDVILTGTPAGVGRIVSGDQIVAQIPGVAELNVTVA